MSDRELEDARGRGVSGAHAELSGREIWRNEMRGSQRGSSGDSDFGCALVLVAVGCILISPLVLFAWTFAWIASFHEGIRGVFEAIPVLSGFTATSVTDEGQPVVVLVVFGVMTLAAVIAIGVVRHRIRRQLEPLRGSERTLLFIAEVLMTLALVVVLVVGSMFSLVAYGIADGYDLRNEIDARPGGVPTVLAAVGFIVVTGAIFYVGERRRRYTTSDHGGVAEWRAE